MATKAKEQADKGVTQCPAGTILFREGESGSRMYVIKSGRVRMSKRVFDTDVTIEELRAGDFCGEIALINQQPRPVTAVVIEDATVIQIEADQFENMLRSNADIALRMLKKMSARLTEAQFRIANYSIRTTKGRLMHQLRQEALRAGGEGLLKSAPVPDDLADVLGLEVGEVKVLLTELVRDELVSIDKRGSFRIADPLTFDRCLKYLELKDHFEYRG